jgi:hypothetical protein
MKNWYVLDKFGSHYVLIEASSPKEAGQLGHEWHNKNGNTFTPSYPALSLQWKSTKATSAR